jgi:hypothetical protein
MSRFRAGFHPPMRLTRLGWDRARAMTFAAMGFTWISFRAAVMYGQTGMLGQRYSPCADSFALVSIIFPDCASPPTG